MKAATKVVMRTLTAGDRFRLVFCCLIAVLAGTSMGLSGEEDNPFESEDSETASTEADCKYVSPNTREAVSPVMLQLPSDTLSKVTTLDKMHRIEVGPSPVSQKQTQLRTYRATLATDREKVIKVLRGLEGNKAFLKRLEQN